MRNLILAMQVTLDGYVEGPNGDMSWLQKEDKEDWNNLFEMLETTDLLIMGGGMFPDYRNYWKKALTSADVVEEEKRYARYAEKTQHIVFSKSIKDPEWSNTRLFDGDAVAEVRKLKEMNGGQIQIVGGAAFAKSMIDAGLVDDYRLVINPAIVTGGKSFYRDLTKKRSLQLIDSKMSKAGTIFLKYLTAKND